MWKTDSFLQGVLLTLSVPPCSQCQPSPGWHWSWFMSQPQHRWGGASPYNIWEGWTFWFSLQWQFSFYLLVCFLSHLIFGEPIQTDTGCSLEANLWFNFRLIHNRTVFCNCIFYLYLLLLETQTVQLKAKEKPERKQLFTNILSFFLFC